MGRIGREEIEGIAKMKKIFLFFIIFFLINNAKAQQIKLEEEIVGEDLSIKKTEIFSYSIPELEIKFPPLPVLNIKKEERKGKENKIVVEVGSYPSFKIYFSRNCKNYTVNFCNIFSNGYRENDSFIHKEISFKYKMEEKNISFGFLNRNMGLPGPVFSPFTESRNSYSMKILFENIKPVKFKISHNYYSVENMRSHFLKFLFSFKKSKIENKNFLQIYDFIDEFLNCTFSSGILFSKENFKIGGSIKFIAGEGVRFLPYFDGNFGNFSVSLKSDYSIPDFWYDFINFNYKEIKGEKLKPFEKYKFMVKYSKRNGSFSFDINLSANLLKRFYIWDDIDLNYLAEPVGVEDAFCSSAGIGVSKKLKNVRIFMDYKRDFYNKDVNYLPEGEGKAGIFLKKGKFEGKLWIEHKGKRKFSDGVFGSFTILNSSLLYKIGKDTIFGIRLNNITGKEYNLFKGYPAEGREILTFFLIEF